MIPYATRTGTLRNLRLMADGGWRLLLSPFEDLSPTPFAYGFDCGAWRAFVRGEPFNVPAFEKALGRVGEKADWVVAPDIVGGGHASLRESMAWLPRLQEVNPLVLVAVQDGLDPDDLKPALEAGAGLFLGGSTEWKEANMGLWGRVAAEAGAYYHIGRVNTGRRIALANAAGANSFDGTSASRFADTIPMLTGATRQPDLWGPPVTEDAPKRGAMTPARMRRIWERERGLCGECGQPVPMRGGSLVRYDHRIPFEICLNDDDANIYPIHRSPCDLIKTARDQADIARARRRRLAAAGQKTPTRNPIRSRGFAKGGPKTVWPKGRGFGRRK